MEGAILYAKRINHGQSEIWCSIGGAGDSPSRTIATNELFNVVRRFCTPDEFDAFHAGCHTGVGQIMQLEVAAVERVLSELNLRPPSDFRGI
jgi:hypothetical protein